MPLKACSQDGKPGYSWGNASKCWTYDPDDEASRRKARAAAVKQGIAIEGPDKVAALKKDAVELVRPRLPAAHLELQDGQPVAVAKVDGEQRLLYGIVLEPDVEDSQEDVVSPEDVEAAAHRFLKAMRAPAREPGDGRPRIVGLQHLAQAPPSVAVVESYVAPADLMIGDAAVLKGSWVIVTHVDDPDIWEAVKKGVFGGYSVAGRGLRSPL